MENEFKHNFCESRLQNNEGPELWNSYTSLVISAFPFLIGFPKSSMFYNIACMLSICLLYTSPSPRDRQKSRMPSSA